MWKKRKQQRLTVAMRQWAAAMRRVEEEPSPRGDQEQSTGQGGGLAGVIFWLFAPRVRLFN
eukprot:7392639-Lingulodinium_polyedra.AAC.1